jgi:hypothetical protein
VRPAVALSDKKYDNMLSDNIISDKITLSADNIMLSDNMLSENMLSDMLSDKRKNMITYCNVIRYYLVILLSDNMVSGCIMLSADNMLPSI